MSAQHTPGPWALYRFLRDHNGVALTGYGVLANIDQREAVICEAYPASHLVVVSEANARLIAAAPELLAFVETVAKRDLVFAKGAKKQVIAEARALAAKARGDA